MRQQGATPALTGMVAALTALLANFAFVAVPLLAAQGFNPRTKSSTLDAVLVSINAFVLGHRGALTVSGRGIEGTVNIAPLGLVLLFALVCAWRMKVAARKLAITESSGVIREGAFATMGMALAGFTTTYSIGATLLSMLGASRIATPNGLSTAFATLVLAALAGALGLASSLTRAERGSVPAVGPLDLVPSPYGGVLAAVSATLLAMLASAALLTGVQLALRYKEVAGLYGSLNPDWVGAVVLTLAQLAYLPTLIVWALAFVLGGVVAAGSGTGVSLEGSVTGVLPTVPMLGALPEPGVFNEWLRLLLLLPVAAVIIGALVLARFTRDVDKRERLISWIAFPVITFIALLVVLNAGSGSFGSAQLAMMGPYLPSLILPVLGIVALPAAAIGAWTQLGAQDWLSAKIADLRARVDRAEEHANDEGEKARPGDAAGERDERDADEGSLSHESSPALTTRRRMRRPSARG